MEKLETERKETMKKEVQALNDFLASHEGRDAIELLALTEKRIVLYELDWADTFESTVYLDANGLYFCDSNPSAEKKVKIDTEKAIEYFHDFHGKSYMKNSIVVYIEDILDKIARDVLQEN